MAISAHPSKYVFIRYFGGWAEIGNLLSISARIERNQGLKEGERVVRRERYSGSVSRSFSLASEIGEATATAQYKDGVLSLTLPKKAASERKRLPIN